MRQKFSGPRGWRQLSYSVFSMNMSMRSRLAQLKKVLSGTVIWNGLLLLMKEPAQSVNSMLRMCSFPRRALWSMLTVR